MLYQQRFPVFQPPKFLTVTLAIFLLAGAFLAGFLLDLGSSNSQSKTQFIAVSEIDRNRVQVALPAVVIT